MSARGFPRELPMPSHQPSSLCGFNIALTVQPLKYLRCFQILHFAEGAESLPSSLSLGTGKEGEIWAELAVNSLKSFLL